MNVRVAKEELELLLPTTMSHYFHDEPMQAAVPAVRRPGLFARMWQWLVEMPKRRAVLDELNMLSDHELADIGLNRSELPRVFDPSFVAERNTMRYAANDFQIRARAA